VKFGGNFSAKKFRPNPLQEIHIDLWLADFPRRKSASQSIYIEVFGEGPGEKPFFKWIIHLTPQ
jgi:hypothetical protein